MTEENAGPELPPTIAEAWGVRQRPGKGPKPGLSVNRIVRAAISTALKEGLPAVSMNRVAGELGTAAMSLYRYVSGKDELLTLMADEAIGPPPEPRGPGEGWREALGRWARTEHERLLEQPWVVQIPISGPPITPNGVRWMEYGLRALWDTGVAEDEKIAVILLVSGYARHTVTLQLQLETAMRSSGDETLMPGYRDLLVRLTDRERFPALHEAMDAGVFDQDDDDDVAFEFGLDRILDGIEVLITSRR